VRPSFSDAELAGVLAQLGVSSDRYQCTSLGGDVTAGATAGIWRVSSLEGSLMPWSVILKVIHHSTAGHRYWLSSADVDHPMYWKREALALVHPRIHPALGQLRPPRVFGVFAAASGEVRLWLEEARGKPALGWALHEYELAARHLGQFQGSFLSRGSLPEERWWSRGWLRAYVERRQDRFATELPRDLWQHPLSKLAFDEDVSASVSTIWSTRQDTFERLERTTQTLCHNDFWSRNLFQGVNPNGSLETLAIDWAYAGIGALGSDVATLMSDAILDGFFPPEQVEVLSDALFEAYRLGLTDAGVDVAALRTLRFAYCAAVSLKYLWVIPGLASLALDKPAQARLVKKLSTSVEQFFIDRGKFNRHLLALAAEAQRLGELVG
jgi:phosphotransferase family enzyme